MSLFSTPEEHAANPPESWTVEKIGPGAWRLGVSGGGTLGTYGTRKEAEAHKVEGFFVELYAKETRWYAGEQVDGWKPYAPH